MEDNRQRNHHTEKQKRNKNKNQEVKSEKMRYKNADKIYE